MFQMACTHGIQGEGFPLSYVKPPELQACVSRRERLFIRAGIDFVHSPGIPIQVEDMHKACNPVCKYLARNDVTIEAAPQANPLSVHPPFYSGDQIEHVFSHCNIAMLTSCSFCFPRRLC